MIHHPLGRALLLITLSCPLSLVAQNINWTWQNPLPTGTHMNDVAMLDANTAWAAGSGGYLLKTIDGGVTWSVHDLMLGLDFMRIQFIDANTGWVACNLNKVLK